MNGHVTSWNQATAIVDRGGARVRYYQKMTDSPPNAVRREMKVKGFYWCKRCKDWYVIDADRGGLCRKHRNELYRESYAKNPDSIRLQKYARKRNLIRIPAWFKRNLFDRFNHQCVYCGKAANTIDHFTPVKMGGNSTPDNLLPCCINCNARKKALHPLQWEKSHSPLSFEAYEILMPTLINSGQIHQLLP